MNIFLTIVGLLVCFVIGAILVSASVKCYVQRKYDGFGVGFMLSIIFIAIVFRLIMSI